MVGADGQLPLPWLAPWLDAARRLRTHALLVHGPEGIGQWELSLTLAQGWLCEAQADPRPCGRCASCRLVQAHAHPDLCVLLPEALQAALGWASGGEGDDAAVAEKSGKTRQPSKEIKVDAVRAAVTFAQTTSARGHGKVLLIHPAERMNGVAANALLKTLEEPPGEAHFVLGCAAPDALLPTIRSRCQALALALPEPAVATEWLAARGVARADVLLAAAGGQPLQALQWVEEGVDAAAWLRLPERVAGGDTGALAGWPLPRAIDALQKLCHDALCLASGAGPRYFPRASLSAAAPAPGGLIEWSRELARAARHAEHPWNAGLMIESLIGQGRKVFAGVDNARSGASDVSVNSRG